MFHYSKEAAEAYSKLGIAGTTYEPGYHEISRCLPRLDGKSALDFGCGPGRSSRYLKSRGASMVHGVDHNKEMIDQALAMAEEGIEYILVQKILPLADASVDAAISVFAFIENKNIDTILIAANEIYRVLKPNGTFVLNTGNPEALRRGGQYISFEYPPNPELQSGEKTLCTMKGDKPQTIEDVFWTEADYERVLLEAGFAIVSTSFPLAEGAGWLDETTLSPHLIYHCVKGD